MSSLLSTFADVQFSWNTCFQFKLSMEVFHKISIGLVFKSTTQSIQKQKEIKYRKVRYPKKRKSLQILLHLSDEQLRWIEKWKFLLIRNNWPEKKSDFVSVNLYKIFLVVVIFVFLFLSVTFTSELCAVLGGFLIFSRI